MNAVEFVREFAVFGAKEYLAGATFYKDKLMVFTDIDDLKQIVDAFELVDKHGGIVNANTIAWRLSKAGLDTQADQMRKAINRVEQCNA